MKHVFLAGLLWVGAIGACPDDFYRLPAQATAHQVQSPIPNVDPGDIPSSAVGPKDKPRNASPAGADYLQKLLKRTPFGTNDFDLAGLRRGMGTRREPKDKDIKLLRVKIDDIPGEWVLAPGADPNLRLLYLHGGGFVAGSSAYYLTVAAHLSSAAKCAVLLPDYRLAPEHRFPAGIEDCVHAHEWMVANGPSGPAPARATFIAGDSAGGCLTLATLLALRDRRKTLPACGIPISPVTDLTLASQSLKTVHDPIISAKTMPVFRDHYLGQANPKNPLASPVFGDYRGIPPLLIQVGEHEMLRDDSVRVAKKARADGIRVKLEVWPGMFHVFQSHEPLLPEAREAFEHIADFMRASLRTGGKAAETSAAELTTLLEKARAKHDVPALAAAILHGDARPRLAVVGVRRRGDEAAAMADDHWHLGSNTKPMTALLIALLIEMGLLDWDTPLEQIFPEHAEHWSEDLKKITPQHLLTHTSGLPGLGPLGAFLLGATDGSPLKDRERAVKSLSTIKLSRKPGEKYEYSNLGYVVLGAIIDRCGKAPWEEQLEKKIFQPLGIKHWSIGPGDAKNSVSHPWPHTSDGKPAAGNGVRDNPPVLNSAGRVRMSAGDYTTFLAETLKLARGNQGLLKAATATKLFTQPHAVSPHTLSGWLNINKQPSKLVLAHDGSNTMNYCTAIVVPDQNLAFCVLTNQGGPGGPGNRACLDLLRQFREREKR